MKKKSIFLLGLTCVICSCTNDEDFNSDYEKTEIRSLSTRSISDTEGGNGPIVARAIEAGTYSGKSVDNKFSVTLNWTSGYLTRPPFTTVKCTASASNAQQQYTNITASGNWIGSNYNVHGTITYRYKVWEIVIDAFGEPHQKEVIKSGSTFFDLCPTVIYKDESIY